MENIEIVNIDTSESEKSLLQLNKEMKSLSKTLDRLDKDSEDYNKVLDKLTKTQNAYSSAGLKMQNNLQKTADRIDGITKTIGGAVGAFSTITGAMGLLGLSGSDTEKELLRVVQALQLMQGMSAIKDIPEGLKKITEAFGLFEDAAVSANTVNEVSKDINVASTASLIENATATDLLAKSKNDSALGIGKSTEEQVKNNITVEQGTETLKEYVFELNAVTNQLELVEKNAREAGNSISFLGDKTNIANKDIKQTNTSLEAAGTTGLASGKAIGTGMTIASRGVTLLKTTIASTGVGLLLLGIGVAVSKLLETFSKFFELLKKRNLSDFNKELKETGKLIEKLNNLNARSTKEIANEVELMNARGVNAKKVYSYELKAMQELRDEEYKRYLAADASYEINKKNTKLKKEDLDKQKEQVKELEKMYQSTEDRINDMIHKNTVEHVASSKAKYDAAKAAKEEELEAERIGLLAIRERLMLEKQLNQGVTYKDSLNDKIKTIENAAQVELDTLINTYNAELNAFELTIEEQHLLLDKFNRDRLAIEKNTSEQIKALRDAERDEQRANIEEQIGFYEQMLSAQVAYTQNYYSQREGSAIESAGLMQEAFALDAAWKLREEYFEKTMALYAKDSKEYKKLEEQKTKEAKINATARKNAETAAIRAGMDFASQAFNVISGLSKEGTKIAKGAASAETIVNGLSASIGLWKGYAPMGPLGIAPMIAQQVLLAGQTAVALKQIWATSDSGSTSPDLSSSIIAPSIPTVNNVLTSADIEAQASSMEKMNIYVSVTDINDMQNKVNVTDRESRF